MRLTQRYGGNPLPTVQIVDMRAELAAGNPREISLSLEDAIRRNLDAGKQTILLLNRRGYQTMAQCEDCREVLKCTKCSVPMVYHKAAHKVLCHYCGSQMEPPTVCPACGGKLQYRGFGTQKAEEELAKLFPDARCCAWIRIPLPQRMPTKNCWQGLRTTNMTSWWAPRWWPRDWILRM